MIKYLNATHFDVGCRHTSDTEIRRRYNRGTLLANFNDDNLFSQLVVLLLLRLAL